MKFPLTFAPLSSAAAIALLAGCGGFQSGPPGAPAASTLAHRTGSRPAPVGPLLYISDAGTGQVQVFNYPAGALYQTLSGFSLPGGECKDPANNVYVTDAGTSTIVEYAHGSATPLSVLSDPGPLPVACAVKTTPVYTVAVANVATTSGPPGSVSVYLNHATSPNFVYSNTAAFWAVNYLGYYIGALYLDGTTSSGGFQFGKMTNSGTITPIAVTGPGGAPAAPGGVQHPPWNVPYIAVGDSAGSKIYHIQTNGYSILSTPNSPTVLTGTCNNILQFFLVKIGPMQHEVINPERCLALTGVYKFPAGGPSGYNYTTSLVNPVGAVVSP